LVPPSLKVLLPLHVEPYLVVVELHLQIVAHMLIISQRLGSLFFFIHMNLSGMNFIKYISIYTYSMYHHFCLKYSNLC
jgi:hypothetical protein